MDMTPLGHINRKTMLYKTKVEYGDWAMNHVQGCTHGCRYPCYAYLMAKRFGRVKSYEEWCTPSIVDNTIELLKTELPRYRNEIKQVQLCFTTDPFMLSYPEITDLTLESVNLINEFDIPCILLTKGILPSELKRTAANENMYGITLTSLDEGYRREMEPGAAPIASRLKALKELHNAGCKTWISMEPYPTPNICSQELLPLLNEASFVDRIVFGRTHYDKRTTNYPNHTEFYRDTAQRVSEFCARHDIDYVIKKGTA